MREPALVTLLLIALVAMSQVACSNRPISPSDLLLARDDFTKENFIEIVREISATNKNEPAVQVELKAPGFTILESLVLFETEELAFAILAGINQDHATLGIDSTSAEGFDDSSGIIVENFDGGQAFTVFFVEGRALMKVTVKGNNEVENVWEIARLAREKAKY